METSNLLTGICIMLLVAVSTLGLWLALANAMFWPEFFVWPAKTEIEGPCENFTIHVKIFNLEETGVGVYAFCFKLLWNSSLIRLVAVEYKENIEKWWEEGTYFVIVNETGVIDATCKGWKWVDPQTGGEMDLSGNWTYYQLAVTALNSAPTINSKGPLVTLVFHIEDCSCCPPVSTSPLALVDTCMSDSNGNPVTHKVEHGLYLYDPPTTREPETDVDPWNPWMWRRIRKYCYPL